MHRSRDRRSSPARCPRRLLPAGPGALPDPAPRPAEHAAPPRPAPPACRAAYASPFYHIINVWVLAAFDGTGTSCGAKDAIQVGVEGAAQGGERARVAPRSRAALHSAAGHTGLRARRCACLQAALRPCRADVPAYAMRRRACWPCCSRAVLPSHRRLAAPLPD